MLPFVQLLVGKKSAIAKNLIKVPSFVEPRFPTSLVSPWRLETGIFFFFGGGKRLNFLLFVNSWFKAKQKKVSASTNIAQIFTGRRSVFFLLKFFTHKIWYVNLNFSRAGNSNSESLGTCRLCRHVSITSIRRTTLPESPRRCVCVGRFTTSQCKTTSSPLFRASSARAPLDRVPQWCEERHCAGVFSY